MATTYIRNGQVISTTGTQILDVLVDGERIAALLDPTSTPYKDPTTTFDQVFDAAGKFVIPGGVDAHTHMEMPFGGTVASDTFETGTRAAAHGGTTTIIDFAIQRHGEHVQDTLAAWHAKASGNCAIDYGFHQIIGGVDDAALAAMNELVAEGVTSFKMFMAYPGVYYSDDGQILRTMQQCASNGALPMIHAENGIAIDQIVAQHLARGETSPYYHGISRPWEMEEEATHRAIMLARVTGAPLYIVHVSAKQALEQIAHARGQGLNVFGETCPQYLYLSLEDQLDTEGFEGAKWVCSTPLRPRHEHHQDDLWRYIRTGDVTTVATDHCPFCFKGQKDMGIDDFSKIPNGLAGVEHRIDLMYQGVVNGHISPQRWVEVCSTAPARTFGLYPRKGIITPGADADIVIYDPTGHTSIGIGKTHHSNIDHSTWEGFEVDGGIQTVISRGTVIVDRGRYLGRKQHGQYLKRSLCQNLI